MRRIGPVASRCGCAAAAVGPAAQAVAADGAGPKDGQSLGPAGNAGVADRRRAVPRAGAARRRRLLARSDRRQGGQLVQAGGRAASRRPTGSTPTGQLDGPTREALLKLGRASTVNVKLGPDDVRSTYVYPLPKDPEKQYKYKFLGYRNMLEKVAERYHTTPATVVALNGPDKLIGPRQTLRLPNVVPASRDYSGSYRERRG